MKQKMFIKHLCFAQVFSVALLAGLCSCSEDKGLEVPQNPTADGGPLWLSGEADPDQTWMTSVSMQVDLSVNGQGTVTAQTIGDATPVVLGQKQVHGKDVLLLDVPQGLGSSFGLVYDDGSASKQYRRVKLTGDLRQLESVTFDGSASQSFGRHKAPVSRSATNSALYGKSDMEDVGYMNFGSWAWDDIALALVEDQDASKFHTSLIDYEIHARGEKDAGGEYHADEGFYISFIYGHTGTTDTRVLGYYTHSADTYSDIEYHDISEVISLDYLNGKAKVQYQIDGNTSVWYDANFDYKDGDRLPSNSRPSAADPKRRGDDAFNTLLVNQAYGDRITAVRGLSYKIEVPKGKKFGFYLRTNGALQTDQRNRLLKLGVPEDRLPSTQINFSFAPMNNLGKHRSAFAVYDNFSFMGLDDSPNNGGDLDCNDVTFALSNLKGEKYRPEFTEETIESSKNQGTIEKHPEYIKPDEPEGEEGEAKLQDWTLGFENAGTAVDFDFNDVVLKVTPDTKNHTVSVWLLATGAERNTRIYYGDTYLGEAHEEFDVNPGNMVNTEEEGLHRSPVLLADDLPWPGSYTMDTHRHLFTIKVTEADGTETTINSNIMLGDKHDIPQVLCVAGDWDWSLERVNVETSYPLLGSWARNVHKSEFWNWYSQPSHGHVFKKKK